VASKSPLHKLQDTVVGTVKAVVTHPVDTAGKAVGQARGTVALGRTVVEHVGKSAAGAVANRLGRGGAESVGETTADAAGETAEAPESGLRAVPDEAQDASAAAPAKKAPAKKAAKKATKKAVRPPVTDVATAAVKKQAANQPVKKAAPAPESPIDAAADTDHVDATPADLAATVPVEKTAKKVAKKAPAKKAAKKAPARSAAELLDDTEVETPVGTTGADVGHNPDTTDTDLQQPGTAPLMDPAITKAVAKEAQTGAAAADPTKGD
jgi:hypothetical protein